MSLFSLVDDRDESASKLSNNLIRIQDWIYKWKMSFNPATAKPAQEVIFSQKLKILLTLIPIVKRAYQKPLGLNPDARFKFNDHINEKISEAIKGVGLLGRL